MRPQIIQHSVEYEKGKFKEWLEVQKKMNIDGLENTRIWLKRNYDVLDLEEDENKGTFKNKVILNSFIELLKLDQQFQTYFPETVTLDEQKVKELKIRLHVQLIVGSCILVIFAYVKSLQSIPNIKEKLKSIINILFTSDLNLDEKTRLENIGLQLIKEIQSNLKENNLIELTKENELNLTDQILDLSNLDNRIRQIVHRRLLEFIEQALFNTNAFSSSQSSLSSPSSPSSSSSSSNDNSSSLQIPTGLSFLKDELFSITAEFLRLVSFNRSVFDEYYDKIIDSFIEDEDN